MVSLFRAMLWTGTQAAESGLGALNSAFAAADSVIGTLAGEDARMTITTPPLNGPRTMDEAVADFASRVALIARSAAESPAELVNFWDGLFSAGMKSFGSLERSGLRQMAAWPVQLPLAFGNLLLQSTLRTLNAANAVGVRKLPDLASWALELYTDLTIFVPLQYKEYMKEAEKRVRRDPKNAGERLRLGRIYIKLGRYPEAVRELAEAAKASGLRAQALQQSLIARVRAGDFSRAIADGAEALALEPSSDRTRFWLWLAAQQVGGYPPEVPENLRMEVKVGRHPATAQYEEVAARIGLDKTSGGRGTAVFDMDGDGYLDVVISSAYAGCSVYRNNGDGTFTDVTVGSGLEDCVNSFAVIAGDYNNDGWDDLFVTRLGFYAGESVLYRNNGDGTFTEVTKEAGVQNWGATFTAQFVDYDCDGHLDLFVSGNQGTFFGRHSPSRLFHNNGDGTFDEVTEAAGISSVSPVIGCAWGDYDNDGYPDLFLSGPGRAQLFHNNGDGTFTDVSRVSGVDSATLGSISFWCDYDNDGWLDIVQCVWSPEEDVLHNLVRGEPPPNGQPLRVYRNNGDGTFTLKSRELGLNECWGTMTGNAGDINNDGHLDIVLGNGGPLMESTEPSVLLENTGDGRFRNTTFSAGLPYTGKGHGATLADLAGDGRLCLIVAGGGFYPADLLTASVFRPKTLPGNYLNVRLAGTRSNRSAIGARLKLHAGARSQHRLVSCGSGFGCLPLEQHFGLGKVNRIDSIEIVWPSGLRQRVDNPPVNATIHITEGVDGWADVYRRQPKHPVGSQDAASRLKPTAPSAITSGQRTSPLG